MPQRDAGREREKGDKVSSCWQRVREWGESEKSESDANAEREADKLAMECKVEGVGGVGGGR